MNKMSAIIKKIIRIERFLCVGDGIQVTDYTLRPTRVLTNNRSRTLVRGVTSYIVRDLVFIVSGANTFT